MIRLVCALVVVAACGGGTAAAPPAPAATSAPTISNRAPADGSQEFAPPLPDAGPQVSSNPIVVDVGRFADQACACADAACATKVQQDFMKYIAEHAETKGSAADKAQLERDAERMMKCLTASQAGSSPPSTTTP